ncbi:hypothetical protein EDD86DRAFT_245786 [Gorgonomyces haynaldii]|nr:hypothetical protein EDD86DRAFT_245786 [Gorgonomyces haynaldii]
MMFEEEKRVVETYAKREPPLGDERPGSRHSDKQVLPPGFAKTLLTTQQQLKASMTQSDRLRMILRERELDLNKLKNENQLLKQASLLFEQQALDAPRIIKGLRDEIAHLKQKIKTYFAQIGEDSRMIRQMDDERHRLRESNTKLEQLVNAKNLPDREVLFQQLEQANGLLHDLQKTHAEKEKVISSLSIYRYNAIHKKNEGPSKLPSMQPPKLHVLSAKQVEVSFELPFGAYEFSRVVISYSKTIEFEDYGQKKVEVSPSSKPVTLNVNIDDLEPAQFYYFHLRPGYVDIDGPPCAAEGILVDVPPQTPKNVSAVVLAESGQLQVQFEKPGFTGSPITSYRLYHSHKPDFVEKYLACDQQAEEMTFVDEKILIFLFSEPQIGVPYYFKVAAVNQAGEGDLNYAPPTPQKPTIKRLFNTAISLSSQVGEFKGSSVEYFTIHVFKTNNGQLQEEQTIKALGKGSEFKHTIENLEANTTYQFHVTASNHCGTSEPSEPSESVDVSAMIPALSHIDVKVASATSLIVWLPPLTAGGKPHIQGYKVCHAVLDGSVPAYVWSALLNNGKQKHCQSAIPLPVTPEPTENGSQSNLYDSKSIKSSPSSSRNSLNSNQKAHNMHSGVPAHHDPPVPLSKAPSSMSLRKSHQSLSNLRGSVQDLSGRKSKPPTSPHRKMPNVYLFRNMITHKVLVSPKFYMADTILNQIGEHRSTLKLRRDHWVPFAVLTGLKTMQESEAITKGITSTYRFPGPFYRLPLKPNPQDEFPQFPGWKTPEQVQQKIEKLCQFLTEYKSEDRLTLHWERDEYRYCNDNLVWPEYISHQKLDLVRNRFPKVPEFDLKNREDEYAPAVIPSKKKDKLVLKRKKLEERTVVLPSGKSWIKKFRVRPEN